MKTVTLILAAMLTGAVVAGGLKIALREKPSAPAECSDHCVVPPPSSGESRPPLQANLSKPEKPAPVRVPEAPVQEAPRAKPTPFSEALSMPERTRPEKEAKEGVLNRTLSERSLPLLQQRFEAGMSEHVNEDPSTSGDPKDEGEIYAVMMKPEGSGAYRTVLPRSEYPDLYRLHDERNRLRKEIARQVRDEQIARTKAESGDSPR